MTEAMTRRAGVLLLLCALAGAVACRAEGVLHLPLDGSAVAVTPAGTLAPAKPGEPVFAPGVHGEALVTDARTRLVYPVASRISMTKGSCSLWVQPVDWTSSDPHFHFFVTLFQTRSDRPARVILYKPHNSEDVTLLMEDRSLGKSVTLQRPAVTWRPGQWHHLAFSWDAAGAFALYADGKRVAEQQGFAFSPGDWALCLGVPWPAWSHLGEGKTLVDDVVFFDHVLSAEEVGARTAEGPPIKTTDGDGGARENLAVKTNGACVLASSFRDLKTFHPDHLLDEDADTVWRAWDNTYPQWVEARWTYPVRVDAIRVDTLPPTAVTAFAVDVWEGGMWRRVRRVDTPDAKPGDALACAFPEAATDRLRVVIESGRGEWTQCTAFQVYGPPQTFFSRLDPYWHAWYIWYPEPDQRHKASAPRYFRKTFSIASLDGLASAFVLARSNDYYRLYINGREAASGARDVTPIPVKEFLRQGENVIAIMADLGKDPGYFGWGTVLAELALNYADGNVYVGTDASWKTSDRLEEGWERNDFDDAAWTASTAFVKPPDGVWGRLPYHATGVQEGVVVRGVSITPETSAPGAEVQVTVELAPDAPLRKDYVFLVELRGEEAVPEYSDFLAASAVIEPNPPTSAWPARAATALTARLRLSRHAPDGAIPLRIRALDKRSGSALRFRREDRITVETFGDVRIRRFASAPPAPKPVAARVVTENGRPVFEIGEQRVAPALWNLFGVTYEECALYTQTGVRIVLLNALDRLVGAPKGIERACAHLDGQIRALLALDPEAYVLVTLELRPDAAWLKACPEEQMVNGFGQRVSVVSFASKRYLDLVDETVVKMVRFLNAQPYANRIIGYRPMSFGRADSVLGGMDGNIWQTDRSKVTMGDYNPQAIRAFQEAMRAKYGDSVAALRAAWKDPDVTFDTARPVIAELTRAPEDGGVFVDPLLGASVKKRDYLEFLSTLIPDNYRRIAQLIKQETGGRALVGIHYGYTTAELRGIHPPGPQGDNNFQLKAMFEEGVIDFVCGAPDYGYRRAGRPHVNMFAQASTSLHKALYVSDSDYRTVLASLETYGRLFSLKESVAVLKRDFATRCIHGFGGWLADFSAGRGRSGVSWYAEPEMLDTIRRMHEIQTEEMRHPHRRTAEIAVFVSGPAWYAHDIYGAQNLYNNLVPRVLWSEMPYLGAPYDVYMMEDLPAPEIRERYKLYVFINAFAPSDAEAQGVESLKRDGKTLLWFYAPGYVNRTTGLTPENISAMTGITIRRKPNAKELMTYTITNADHPITRGTAAGTQLGAIGFGNPQALAMHPAEIGPVFYVEDARATALGAYPDGRIALACKDQGGWKSVYCAAPYLSRDLLRGAAAWAGVHFYTEAGVIMDASERLVMLHNGPDEVRRVTVTLPAPGDVVDAWTGEIIARKAARFDVTLDTLDTRLFRLE